MSRIMLIVMFLLIVGIIFFFIYTGAKKPQSGTKLMLLGLEVTLIGGIIAVDPGSNLGGFEYLIALAGLVTTIIGFNKEQ